jgi:D-alanyl-lipoteichoic acid acyltransferase DltB (MBOAT superfamily)
MYFVLVQFPWLWLRCIIAIPMLSVFFMEIAQLLLQKYIIGHVCKKEISKTNHVGDFIYNCICFNWINTFTFNSITTIKHTHFTTSLLLTYYHYTKTHQESSDDDEDADDASERSSLPLDMDSISITTGFGVL